MTTSWTPLACRSTQCRCHAMGCAQPINGRLSIGLGRVELLVLAGVPSRTTFTAVQAREHAPAATRRSICDCSWPRGVEAGSSSKPPSGSATDNRVRPFAPSRDRDRPFRVFARVQSSRQRRRKAGTDFVRTNDVHVCGTNLHAGGNIGEAQPRGSDSMRTRTEHGQSHQSD